MSNTTRSRHASVQFADPAAPDGVEVSRTDFLKQCRQAASARFRRHDPSWVGCRTIEHPVPAVVGNASSTGLIIAHISPAVCRAWEATMPGTPAQKRKAVEAQVQLALTDLADQDMHGYLALTDAQCALFEPDLVQLVAESLDRTSFARLAQPPDAHWEGTLVESIRPPYLILDVSIDFADPVGRKAAGPLVRSGRRRAGPSDATFDEADA